MKKSEDEQNIQIKKDCDNNSANGGSGGKSTYNGELAELSYILSEINDIGIKLDNLMGTKKGDELYGEDFKSLRNKFGYVKEDLILRIESLKSGSGHYVSPYRGKENDEGSGEREHFDDSELKNANILLIKEILERRYIEKELKQSLKEKDVLFKEIHHRVKNNLQIISSLLNLQSRQIRDQDAVASFNESKNRIRSIATLHEGLYRSKDLSKIDFTAYMRNITNYLFHSYGVGGGYINFVMDSQSIYLDLNTAIPCGLIVNELVSNAIIHGFPRSGYDENHPQGEIKIDFRKEGNKYYLSVSNNGVKFPEDLDIDNSGTLGLELVTSLSRQLRGKISLLRNEKTEFRLEFAA